MNRRFAVTILGLFACGWLLLADAAEGNPRLSKLFGHFIAPCCWRENLLSHHSPEADKMRAEIRSMVAAGETDETIKQTFVNRHSIRVLSLPEGARARWLWWTPVAMSLAGLGAVAWVIRRSMGSGTAAVEVPQARPLPEISEMEWD